MANMADIIRVFKLLDCGVQPVFTACRENKTAVARRD